MPESGSQLDEQFQGLVDTLTEYYAVHGDALDNMAQPTWLNLSEKMNTRKELLEKLDRVALNKKYTDKMHPALAETPTGSFVGLMLQHDVLAGVAKNVYSVRRPRLQRIFARIATSKGSGGPDGVVARGVLARVKSLIEENQ